MILPKLSTKKRLVFHQQNLHNRFFSEMVYMKWTLVNLWCFVGDNTKKLLHEKVKLETCKYMVQT